VSPDTATYGGLTTFSLNTGSAGDGDVTVTITDAGDPACTMSFVVADPGPCSESCNLTGTGLDNVACNDNSTMDPSDDFITFTLDPTGSLLGPDYNVSVSNGTVLPTSGAYGNAASYSLNIGSAGDGDVTITITDASDANCILSVTLTDPGTCSQQPCEVAACDISTQSETMICVDEGVTDSVVVICHPGMIGMSSSWLITDTAGIIQSIVSFTDTAVFTFEGQPSGNSFIWLVAWDGTINGLLVGQDVDALSGCFDLSNSISVTQLTGTECESSTFNPALNDLIRIYPNPVSGRLKIEVTDVTIHAVQITDVMGRKLMQLNTLNPTEIDMSVFDSGLYYILFETPLGWSVQHLVVSK
jgi:hypothetical protein